MKRNGMQADHRTRVHFFSLLVTSKKGKIIRNERRRRMFNYQYFWNIFWNIFVVYPWLKRSEIAISRVHYRSNVFREKKPTQQNAICLIIYVHG